MLEMEHGRGLFFHEMERKLMFLFVAPISLEQIHTKEKMHRSKSLQ